MPVVVIAVVLIAVVPAVSVLILNKGAELPPTIPAKVVVPLSVTVNAKAVGDCSVEINVTPTPVKLVVAPKVTASL